MLYDGSASHNSKTRVATAYFLLFIQLLTPILISFSSATYANEAVVINNKNNIAAEKNAGSASSSSFLKNKPQQVTKEPHPPLNTSVGKPNELPTLELSDSQGNVPRSQQNNVAQGMAQTGKILSEHNTRDASVAYAQSLGQNLINQQITQWLNQYGSARVQLNTQKTGDIDLFSPVIDDPEKMLFAQIGARATPDRTTSNLGLGYRQFQDNWMWGINGFYDYDMTGKNSRLGLGTELNFDYLKFSGNGYFRLTDWHPSKLSNMYDYNERPANGYDLRVDTWLPAYPQFGAFAKHEHYFGDGINLSTRQASADSLKNSPKRSTFGVNYTPFPMLTLKGQTSPGSSGEHHLGIDLTYRFGMPLHQQLAANHVDAMRSLAGGRYDFVERNNNIVMQYQKQALLVISLPSDLDASTSETVPVTATINKEKYGLKDLEWSAPELVAQGGKIQATSKTSINLTLPDYEVLRTATPKKYRLSVTGTDNQGNQSNTATMWVNVTPGQSTLSQLTLSPDEILLANTQASYTASALIKNEKGNALDNQTVTFSVSGFADNAKVILTNRAGESGQAVVAITDTQGYASVTVKSALAGEGQLTATIKNNDSKTIALRFQADSQNPEITEALVIQNDAVANGNAYNIARTTVKDKLGNPIANFKLSATATRGAVITAPVQVTDSQGQVITTLTNTQAGPSELTITGDGVEQTVVANFIADINTGLIQDAFIQKDNAIADGQDTNIVVITATDGQGNPLPDAQIAITVPVSASYQTQPAQGKTDNQGQLVVTLTNTKAGADHYIFSINNTPETLNLTFDSDSKNPSALHSILEATPTLITANGVSTATLTVTLNDNFNNKITDGTVEFTTTLANTTLSPVVNYLDGTYTAKLVGTQAGNALITVLANHQPLAVEPVTVQLVAASPEAARSAISLDNNHYLAGSEITATVTLQDAYGNHISGQAAALTAATVLVPNTTIKPGSQWLDNGNGTYQQTYLAEIAGQALQARLQLNGWANGVSSADYLIAASAAVSSGSTLTLDNTQYRSGSDIIATVSLKDAQGNSVSRQAASLTTEAVSVPNVVDPAGSGWADNLDGTYTNHYQAGRAAHPLQATLQLSSWADTLSSAPYAIVASDPIENRSTIELNAPAYTAGSEITVSVSLKDAQSNGVSGQEAMLTSTTVRVPNATIKPGSQWVDQNEGHYSQTYLAEIAGEELQASLQLNGWGSGIASADYRITAGSSVPSTSALTLDKTQYASGSDITVTVVLKDAQGNGLSGQIAALTTTAVSVPNVTNLAGSDWTESPNGLYTNHYQADIAGTQLQATLQLNGWTDTLSSARYDIVAGSAVLSTSAIALDKPAYSAGEEMTVTVTLQDAQSNRVTGQAAALVAASVLVPNATVKPDSQWLDNGNGIYSHTYIAQTVGADLTATLQLTDWDNAAQSAPYFITAGATVQTSSAIELDHAAYIAGDEMHITVTLKDSQGNPATNQASVLNLNTVKIPNATLKVGNSWIEQADGRYLNTYLAITSGSDLTATLQLSDWSMPVESQHYAIAAGNAIPTASEMTLNAANYIAGSEMAVTIYLKDTQGNPVTGQAAELNSSTVVVAHATAKENSGWADNQDGSYTGTYLAQTAASGLTATVQLRDWSQPVSSASYSITHGTPEPALSLISTNAPDYVAGGEMTVTVILRDSQGNAIAGQSALLDASAVTVANAQPKPDTPWVDHADGTYTGSYLAQKAGDSLSASLRLNGWAEPILSGAYQITADIPAEVTSHVTVDAADYVAGAEITVTVSLKDALGNPVIGKAAELTGSTVAVANAQEKGDTGWIDNQDGRYTGLYLAQTAASGLVATVQLSGWSQPVSSARYRITHGTPEPALSLISADAPDYVAGSEMTVTVILKDSQGNAVAGQAALLSISTVTVDNAQPKPDATWVDNTDGSYTGSYLAQAAGTNLKAFLQLSEWTESLSSAAYQIVAGTAVATTSGVTVDTTHYVAGAEVAVTVSLKDAQGNPIIGKASELTPSTVTVANTVEKADTSWTDNLDGSYTGVYLAQHTGTGLTAKIQLSGWIEPIASAAYSITFDIHSAHLAINWVNNRALVIADNYDANLLSGQVVDGYNNVVPNTQINVRLPAGLSLSDQRENIITDENGKIEFSLISSQAGAFEVGASVASLSNESLVTVNFSPVVMNLQINISPTELRK